MDIETWDELINSYDDALDEQGSVTIGGLTYAPSRVLAGVDPIAYRCGLLDYADALDVDTDTLGGVDTTP